jgi:hypothetical protein
MNEMSDRLESAMGYVSDSIVDLKSANVELGLQIADEVGRARVHAERSHLDNTEQLRRMDERAKSAHRDESNSNDKIVDFLDNIQRGREPVYLVDTKPGTHKTR